MSSSQAQEPLNFASKSTSAPPSPPDLLFGRFRLQRASRRLLAGDTTITLPPKAFDLLELLVCRRGAVVSKDDIMLALWGDVAVEEGNLTQTVFVLRKLLDAPGNSLVETVPRRGYRLVPPVTDVHTIEPPVALPPGPSEAASPPRAHWLRLVVVALLVGGAAAAGFWTLPALRRSDALPAVVSASRITQTGDVGWSALSGDGRLLVYTRRGTEGDSIWVRRLASGAEVQIVPPLPVAVPYVTISPDGDWVYYVAADQPSASLWRVGSLGGTPARVLSDISSPAAVSPDGRRVAFIRWHEARGDRVLVVANADGGGEREVFARRSPAVIVYGGLGWSPDGRDVAVVVNETFGGRRAQVWAVGVDGSASALASSARAIGDVAWNTNGVLWPCDRSLLVTDGQVSRMSSPGGEAERITRDASYYRAPGGSGCDRFTVIQERETSTIWVAPGGDFGVAKILLAEAGHNHGMAWLPDGRLVYESRRAGNVDLWIVGADGSAPRQLTTDPAPDTFPSVTPDGRAVVFSSGRAGGATLWRTEVDGSGTQPLTHEGAHYAPDVSPDGRTIAFHAADPVLSWVAMRIGIDGGPAVALTTRPATFPVFSPDGMRIAVNYLREDAGDRGWSIALLRARDGAVERIVDVFGVPTRRLAWSPDGTSLLASDPDNRVRAIPVDGRAISVTVEAPRTERVLAFAVSRPSGDIAFVRSERLSDVVLVSKDDR